MGTRHLIAVFVDGQYKVAQYAQWDGYPSGQGVEVLEFCRNMDRVAFTEKVRAARFLTEQDIKDLNARIDAEKIRDWSEAWPWLSRDAGAGILQMVMEHEPGIKLRNSIQFAADSLFCEWAYVIDLDKNTFEAFKGFNQEPLAEDELFYGATSDDMARGYHPVKLAASWPLDALPDEETFLATLEPEEEEDEDA